MPSTTHDYNLSLGIEAYQVLFTDDQSTYKRVASIFKSIVKYNDSMDNNARTLDGADGQRLQEGYLWLMSARMIHGGSTTGARESEREDERLPRCASDEIDQAQYLCLPDRRDT